MKIRQFEVWIADLNPRIGTETGKIRPVVIIQTDLLNEIHSSVLICPITSKVQIESDILRVHIKKGIANLESASDVLVDQIRAIDKKRLIQKLGTLPEKEEKKIKENIRVVLDL